MGVRIRLVRMGLKRNPIYNITVSDNKRGLNKKPIEVIGTYDAHSKPLPGAPDKKLKEVHLDFERARYWLGVGAQPSDTISSLFRKFGIMPKPSPTTHKK